LRTWLVDEIRAGGFELDPRESRAISLLLREMAGTGKLAELLRTLSSRSSNGDSLRKALVELVVQRLADERHSEDPDASPDDDLA
jgi:hypothetical protein